jgi:hypothetical protein
MQDFTLQKGERMQKLFRSLIAVGGLMGLAACGDDVSVTEPPPPPLTISGAPVTAVQVGARVQLSASEAATWASSAANVASVDANGLVTAAAAGTASITATATADVNRKASVTITVVAPAVRSVVVSPAAVTMNPGGTQGFVANVDADAGVARTVTWSSSNTAVVTVTAAGVATAVAPGAATITATSTANTSVAGAASVTVRTPTPANVTIDRVTVGNTLTPVNFLAVVGQIDVSVNVDPGDFVLSKVDLLVDGVVCPGCTQTFSEEQSRALSAAAVYGDEVAGAVSNILFSVQTALFNATTGVPSWTNKQHTVSARATLTNAGQTSTAASNRDMTFANANTWVATLAFTGTTASATGTTNSAAGLAYRKGGLTVTALPVIYNEGQSIVAAGGQVRFGSGCDASGTGQRNVPLTGTGPFTAAFPQTIPAGGNVVNTVNNYEFSSPACGAGLPETPTLVAVDNSGNNIFNNVGPCVPAGTPGFPAAGIPAGQFCPPGSVAAIRLDNRPPGPPTFWGNPNGRENGWINAAVAIGSNTSGSLTSNNWLVNGTLDQGIGGGGVTPSATSYQRFIRVGDNAAGTAAVANAATASSTFTLPAPSITSSSLCAVITSRDELANESALPANNAACTPPPGGPPSLPSTPVAAQLLAFGVDIAAPTATFTLASIASNARISGAALAGEFIVAMADTGAVGNSGMLAGTPLRASVVRREATGTSFTIAPSDCVVGSVSNGVCTQSATGITNTVITTGTANTNTLAAQTVANGGTGYYTFDGTAVDAAGNSTVVPTRVAVYDNTPAFATPPAVPATITGPFAAAAFLNDELSIRDYFWTVNWNTALLSVTTATIAAQPTAVDAYNAPVLNNTNLGINQIINTFLGLQNGQGATPAAYTANANPMNLLNLFVRDQTQPGYSGPAPLGAPVVASQSPVAPTIAATAGVSVTNFNGAFASATTNATICAGTLPAGCAAVPTSTNFTATAAGATAVFNNPFTRVDFYAVNAAGTNLVLIGSVPAAAATLVDNGIAVGGRVWTYTLPMTAATLYTLLGGVSPAIVGPVNVYAFGAAPGGLVALVSPLVAHTINP